MVISFSKTRPPTVPNNTPILVYIPCLGKICLLHRWFYHWRLVSNLSKFSTYAPLLTWKTTTDIWTIQIEIRIVLNNHLNSLITSWTKTVSRIRKRHPLHINLLSPLKYFCPGLPPFVHISGCILQLCKVELVSGFIFKGGVAHLNRRRALGDSYLPPPNFVCRGYNQFSLKSWKLMYQSHVKSWKLNEIWHNYILNKKAVMTVCH